VFSFAHPSARELRHDFLRRTSIVDLEGICLPAGFSVADIAERKFWDACMQAYAHALGATSTTDSPWFIVPADDTDNARLMVSQIVLDAFLRRSTLRWRTGCLGRSITLTCRPVAVFTKCTGHGMGPRKSTGNLCGAAVLSVLVGMRRIAPGVH